MNLKDKLALLSQQSGSRSSLALSDGTADKPLSTAERLERLLASSARREATRRIAEGEVAALLSGGVIADGVVLVERFIAADYVHGTEPLARLFEAPLHVLNGDPSIACEGLLFLDTETTGLAGGTGTLPFLLGIARIEPEGLRVRQYFLTGFKGEAAMLQHARAWIEDASHLVTFNGKSFDIPLLATRYRLLQLAAPFSAKGHLDLLHPTRTAFSNAWPDCRLQTAEQRLLGYVRENDLAAHLVPEVWTQFVRLGRIEAVPRVLEHNRWDVVSLAGLLARLAAIFAGGDHAEADALALARRHLARGDEGCAFRRLADCGHNLGIEGLLELARLHRRRGAWEKAAEIWEALAGRDVVPAIEQLAKYHEHRRGDFETALALTERLLAARRADAIQLRRKERLLARSTRQREPQPPLVGIETREA